MGNTYESVNEFWKTRNEKNRDFTTIIILYMECSNTSNLLNFGSFITECVVSSHLPQLQQ